MPKDTKMTTTDDAPQWARQLEEPEPGCVTVAPYCSLGPNRAEIINTAFGSRLWELLMAATEPFPPDTHLLTVCPDPATLLNLLRACA